MPERFAAAAALLRSAIAAGAFPAASVEVGRADGAIWRDATGRLTYHAEAAPVDRETVFDLASLTKVLATTMLVDARRRRRTADARRPWSPTAARNGGDRPRDEVTIRDLFAHARDSPRICLSSGTIPGASSSNPRSATSRSIRAADSQSIYSDLGFILLGFILEERAVAPGVPARTGTFDPSRQLAHQFRPSVRSFFTTDR